MIRVRLDRGGYVPTLHLYQGENGTTLVKLEVPRYDGNVDLMMCNFKIRVTTPTGSTINITPYSVPRLYNEYIQIEWMIDSNVSNVKGVGTYCVVGSGSANGWTHTYVSGNGPIVVDEVPTYIPGTVHVDELAEYMAEVEDAVDTAVELGATLTELTANARAAALAANNAADRLTTGTPIPGKAATIEIGTVTQGTTPSVTNVGDENEAVLNFVIPKGEKGDNGTTPTLSVDTVTTLDAGEAASVTMTQIASDNYKIKFAIPKGAQGAKGDQGDPGKDAPTDQLHTHANMSILNSIPSRFPSSYVYGMNLVVNSSRNGLEWGTPHELFLFNSSKSRVGTYYYSDGTQAYYLPVYRNTLFNVTVGTSAKTFVFQTTKLNKVFPIRIFGYAMLSNVTIPIGMYYSSSNFACAYVNADGDLVVKCSAAGTATIFIDYAQIN